MEEKNLSHVINRATEVPFNPKSSLKHHGNKLSPVKETFKLDSGSYTGKITHAFYYADEKIMLKIKLNGGGTFIAVTDEKHINKYPYSQLVMESSAEYVDQLVGLDVDFTVRNSDSGIGTPYSNIRKISLRKQ